MLSVYQLEEAIHTGSKKPTYLGRLLARVFGIIFLIIEVRWVGNDADHGPAFNIP